MKLEKTENRDNTSYSKVYIRQIRPMKHCDGGQGYSELHEPFIDEDDWHDESEEQELIDLYKGNVEGTWNRIVFDERFIEMQ